MSGTRNPVRAMPVEPRKWPTVVACLWLGAVLLGAAPPPRTTESAHFTVTHGRAQEEILAPYLLDALEAERERLAASGVALQEGKLPVEIVAGPADLDRLTSLDAKDVAAGSAVACQEGRLVLVSPRAAAGGYPWIDAAVAEYGRCAGATSAGRARLATPAVRWKGAPSPKRDKGARAELARVYARLGDILRARGRNVPARIEYEKAMRRGGSTDPDIVARYAQATLSTGSAGAAEGPLRDAAAAHPRHAGVLAALGKAEAKRGDWAAARDAYAAAIRVDPFDAEVHTGLSAALGELGDATGASRENRIAEMLRR